MSVWSDTIARQSPTAWWRFDDLANPPSDNSYDATVIARADCVALWDATGANLKNPGTHTGTVSGNPVVVEGPLIGATNGGGALDYDGTGDQISVPLAAALNPAAFTVGAWIYRDVDTGATETIYDSTNAAATKGFVLRVTSSDQLQIAVGDGAAASNVTSTATVPTGRWVHVAATYDGASVTLWMDSAVVAGPTADGYVPNDDAGTVIGRRRAGVSFNGKIAKPSLHNAALTASQIGSLFVKGRPVSDTQGSHTGGMIGNPTSATGAISGDTNAAFDFGGVTSRVIVPYAAALNAATFSMSGWIKRDTDTAASEVIWDSRPAGTNTSGIQVGVDASDKLFALIGGASSAQAVGTTSLAVGTWYHVGVTYDGTNARVYVNGTLEGTSAAVTHVANASAPVSIGSRNPLIGAALLFNGKIDELTYHGGVVLTQAQINAQINAANRALITGYAHTTQLPPLRPTTHIAAA